MVEAPRPTPRPAMTLVEVSRLFADEFLIEIEAVAVKRALGAPEWLSDFVPRVARADASVFLLGLGHA